jgi:hypothetical protein
MADNPLFLNGIQQIRVNARYAREHPETFRIEIPANGSHTINNYALMYFGHDQPKKQEIIINATFSDSPFMKIGYEMKDNKYHCYAIDIVQNETIAEFTLNQYNENDVYGFGVVHVVDYPNIGDKYYGLGVNSVAYYNGDKLVHISIGDGTFTYGLVSGNSIEIKNTSDKAASINYGDWCFLSQMTGMGSDMTTSIMQVTTENNDFPKPEKTTDTSDLDPKGGGGTETNRSDTIDTPDNTAELNSHSGVQAGFISLYSPTTSQLRSLASYLWTSDFVDNVKKMFGDPMDVIIGLTQMPFTVPTGASSSVKAGFIDTGITMPRVAQQYIDFDMGSIKYGTYWGNALDFDPYTKVQIYLPFIGFRTLNTNDVINSTVSLKYRIDCLTGAVTAWVSSGSFVKYEFSGQCGASIPVTSQNYYNVINTAINIVSTVGTGIIGGVATGGLGTMASMATVNGISNVASGVASGSMKPTVQRSGGMGGASSLMGMRTPYLVFQRPKTSLPTNYNSVYGYACNKFLKLGNCKGFTQVEHMHLQVAGATDDEMKEIENILHKGVFI